MTLWRWLTLAVISYSRSALSCSTNVYDHAFDQYLPFPCAARCLACPNADYRDNFANNCNYSTGECCQSRHHTIIVASWQCVHELCSAAAAQDAFAVFVKHCKDVGASLAAEDVPPGFNTGSSSMLKSQKPGWGTQRYNGFVQLHVQPTLMIPVSGTNGSDDDAKDGLSKEAKIGVITGTIGGVVAILGVIIAYRQYKKKHSDHGPGNALQHHPQGAMTAALFAPGANGSVIYENSTTVFGLTLWKRTHELRPGSGPPLRPSNAYLRGRVLGEEV